MSQPTLLPIKFQEHLQVRKQPQTGFLSFRSFSALLLEFRGGKSIFRSGSIAGTLDVWQDLF